MIIRGRTIKKYIICICAGIAVGAFIKCLPDASFIKAFSPQGRLTVICDAGHGASVKCFKRQSLILSEPFMNLYQNPYP